MRVLLRVAIGLVAVLLVAAGVLFVSLRPPPPLAVPDRGATLAGVTVVNPGVGRMPSQTVVVDGARIAEIRSEAGAASPFAGHFVLPGLIDLHVHFPPPSGLGMSAHFGLLFLRYGVTTVRSAADVDGTSVPAARGGVEAARFPGPRIFDCGPLLDGGDPRWANTEVVLEPADAGAAVDRLVAAGSDCVKVYDSLTAESLAAVIAAAERRGLPVIGHVPYATRFEDSRIGDVQHLTGIAGYPDQGLRFPKNMGLWQQVDDARMDAVVAAALANDMAVTPTLITAERFSRLGDHAALANEPDAWLVPRFFRDVVWARPAVYDDADFAALAAAGPVQGRMIRRLHAAGARVHVGTDALVSFVVPGASIHREMQLFADAGFSADEVWTLATSGNAAALDVPGLGRVESGAPADLLVYREDPTRDLAAHETLVAVVADGRLYSRADLEAQVVRAQRHHEGAVFDAVSVEVARRVLARASAGGEE